MSTAQGNNRGSAPLDSQGVKAVSKVRAQTAVIYDLLSEGPIEGLVDGVASIRLNDNPVANGTNAAILSPQRSFDANYVHSTGVITDNSTGNIFSGASTADGTREIIVQGASKRTTSTITTVAGNNIVVSSNTSFFASTDVWDGSGIQPMIRIDGAGDNGGQLVAGITEHINNAAVRVDLTPMTSISGTNAYLDLKDTIDSFSGNTATISAAGVTVANTGIQMSSPFRASNAAPLYNYENFGFAFRTGTREQAYLPTPSGIGSASVAHQVSGGNISTSSSSGYPSASAFGFEETSSYTGSALQVTSASMGVGNASEIDAVKITLQFNSMISQKETGKLGNGFAEYRIKFGYSRDGGSTYQDVTKVGRPTIATSTSSYHKNGRTKDSQSGIITGKTRQPFNHVYTFDISKYQPFDAYRISVERISAENQKENKWQQTNTGTVKQIENIITDKLTYPYSAYAGVVVDAKDFNAIPKRSYEIRGLKVKVPTNYFPLDEANTATGVRRSTAAYTRNVTSGAEEASVQDWDGNFRGDQKTFTSPTHANYEPVYTNNPIWIFYDLLTNQRYGLGKYLDEDFDFSQIDKYTLFQLAKYCDELVPDGKGGTEPRFTTNLYIPKDQDALKILKNLASQLRAMVIWFNGQVTLGMNQQKGAIYTFSKSNVIGGEFAYAGSAGRFRNNQIAVSWNDPDNGYKQAVEVVEDHDNIARTGKVRRKNITAYGCTSQGQAIRHGKYQLLSEQLEKEVVNFKTGLNALGLKPGDVIKVQDGDLQDIVTSGRVTTSASSTTTIIRTDRDLTSFLNNDDNFKLHLIYPSGGAYLAQPIATINSVTYNSGDLILLDEDGAAIDTQAKASNLKDDSGAVVQTFWSDDLRIETKAISSFNATSVTVSSAFSSAPNGEVIYTISGETDDNVIKPGTFKEYIITSIKHEDDMTVGVSAAAYERAKFDAVDRGWKVPAYPDTLYKPPARGDEVPAPIGLTAQLVPGNSAGGHNVGEGDNENDYSIVLNWTHPTTQRTDSDGNSLTDVYEHLLGYNIQHNIEGINDDRDANREFTTVFLDSNNKSNYVFNNIVPSSYKFRVQTVATNGKTSGWIQRTLEFPDSAYAIFGQGSIPAGMNHYIQKGGVLTTVVDVNSTDGTCTFANNTYVFTPPNSVSPITVSNGTTAQTVQGDFEELANGSKGFLLFDYSNTANPLKAISLVTDTAAVDAATNGKLNYQFMARIGESNNDLIQATGTVSVTAGLPEVTGSSTTFTSDFTEGDIIAIDTAGATRFMGRVIEVANNTHLVMDSSPTRAYSGKTVHKQGLIFDHLKDSIIGEVANNAGTFTYTAFTNKLKIDNSGEIADNTVNASIIANNAIGAIHISANSIGAAAIVADSIDNSHIAANSINAASIIGGSITNAEIAGNTITTANIQANAITSSQLSASAVGSVSISANQITSVEIAANSIGSSEIAANSVNGTIITGNAVGSSEISANSVNGIIIAGGAVDTSQIAGSAISAAKLAAEAVTEEKIQDDAVSNPKIAANAVETVQLKSNSVTAAIIVANAIGSSEIAANAINSVIVAANSIGSNQISANSINAAAILAGTITNTQIAGNTINSAVIQAGAVDTNQIAGNAITSAKIAANAVDVAEIKANAITSAKIAANAVDSAEIKSGSIDTVHIGANQITSAKIAAGNIDTAEIAANAIENAKISSTDSMTLTVGGGTAGGWALTPSTFASTNASGGANASFASAGITLGSGGFISAPQFYIDTDGNAKFKGTLEGNDVTVNGNLTIPSSGGSSTVSFTVNDLNTRFICSVGSGAGFYSGFIKLSGGTSHVKTMGFYFIEDTATSGASSANEVDTRSVEFDTKLPLSSTSFATRAHAIYPSSEAVPTSTSTAEGSASSIQYGLRPDHFDASAGEGGVTSDNRLFTGHNTVNMPFMFAYSGTAGVNLFFRAQGDSGTDSCTVEARFIKFGI